MQAHRKICWKEKCNSNCEREVLRLDKTESDSDDENDEDDSENEEDTAEESMQKAIKFYKKHKQTDKQSLTKQLEYQ